MAEETNSLDEKTVAQRPSKGKNYKLIGICLLGVILFDLLSTDWRLPTLKYSVLMAILLAPLIVALVGTVRKKAWSPYAALSVLLFWLLMASWYLLVILGIIKFFLFHYDAIQISSYILGSACVVLGMIACVIGKSHTKNVFKILVFSLFFVLEIFVVGVAALSPLRITYEDDVARYTKLIKRYPNDVFLYEDRAKIYKRMGNNYYDAKIKDIHKAISLGSKELAFYLEDGLALRSHREYGQAVSEFSQGMALCGSDSLEFSKFLFFRAWTYMQMRRYDSAVDDIRRLRKISVWPGDHGLGAYFISQSFLIRGQYDSAIAEYEKEKEEIRKLGVKNFHDSLDLRNSDEEIIKLYCAKGDYSDALRNLNAAFEDGSRISAIGYYAGLVNYLSGNYEEAKHDFEVYLSSAKGDENTEYYLSSLLASGGHTKEALEHFDKALQLGFRFFDLVNENDDPRSLRNDPAYQKLLRDHFKNGGIHAEEDTLRQIFKQDRIIYRDHAYVEGQDRLLFSEQLIATSRAEEIFWMPNHQVEYRKLEQLITEE